jgi:beta-glucosidase
LWYCEQASRQPLCYVGFGLSYTKFEHSNLVLPSIFEGREDFVLTVWLDVENVGPRDRAEVVQVYVADLVCSVQRPRKELKAFTKAYLVKGEERTFGIKLDKYALSFWSEEHEKWRVGAGEFEVIIGNSADPRNEVLKGTFNVPETFMWSGL